MVHRMTQITKREARRRFYCGGTIELCPCKLRPQGPFSPILYMHGNYWLGDRYEVCPEWMTWIRMYNEWCWNNASSETGYYPHYYVEHTMFDTEVRVNLWEDVIYISLLAEVAEVLSEGKVKLMTQTPEENLEGLLKAAEIRGIMGDRCEELGIPLMLEYNRKMAEQMRKDARCVQNLIKKSKG